MEKYLIKHALYPRIIQTIPSDDLEMIVVIPCYNEPDLISSLDSLKNCEPTPCHTEVIVVINNSAEAEEAVMVRNKKTYEVASIWKEANDSSNLTFHIILKDDLPLKHAGVGLARKIGMDEACHRFLTAGNEDGIILCFDADTLANKNYFKSILKHFSENPKTSAASIHFEHPLEGSEYSDKVYQAILEYELHLRIYINGLRYAGLEWAFQTIGSSMVVRAKDYCSQGGMNRRKAGEDFYFLHKYTVLGKLSEINTTTVIPSPRPSDRVPFGTGRKVGQLIGGEEMMDTYAPKSYEDLRIFIEQIEDIYETKTTENIEIPTAIVAFLNTVDFKKHLQEIRSQTTNYDQFRIRFFKWFNAFKVMKFLHFARDNYYSNVDLESAVEWALKKRFSIEHSDLTLKKALLEFRKHDKNNTDPKKKESEDKSLS